MKLQSVRVVAFVAAVVVAAGLVASVPLGGMGSEESVLGGSRVRYDGESVVRARIDTVAKASVVENLGLDVWDQSGEGVWDLRVNGAQLTLLQSHGIETEMYISDLQGLIDGERLRLSTSTSSSTAQGEGEGADPFFNDYRRYDEIVAFYKQRAAQYPSLVVKSGVVVGKSIEGRDILAFHLRGKATGARKLFWEGGIHAREWISPPTVAYQFDKLLSLYGSDADATYLLDTFEIIIVPVVNPDGYEYSHTRDRLWRKNRRVNSGSACAGVDLNRNWDAQWAQGGSSNSPCSDTYHGTAAFSEPETKAVSNYFLQQGNIQAAIDFHAYSQLILRPYGHTRADAPDETNMRTAGSQMASAIKAQSGLTYTNQKSIELYVTTGTANDWFYTGTRNYSWGYTIELRDTGRYGFLLPADQIVPQGEEIWAAMKVFGKYVAQNHP